MPDEKPIPEDGLFLFLLKPREEHGEQKRRAIDAYWSKKTYRLYHIIAEPNIRVLYHLANGPYRSFVSEEWMQIPEDVEVPPVYVKEWLG